MNLLLLSNSTNEGGYLRYALAAIQEWSGGVRQALFVPFAGVTRDWDDYTGMVGTALGETGLEVTGVHRSDDPLRSVRDAQLLLVGGGNTFQLLKVLRERGLLDAIRERVRGGTPYLGWSAGSNLACPGIFTTNDMPIVDPGGFGALGLVDFQINPHYTNAMPEGVRGETRNQRIAEFTRVNPAVPVLGLPEGNWVRVRGGQAVLHGPHTAWWFQGSLAPQPLQAGPLPTVQ